ncbi:6,7-dimethyl-8-ribityllumazine synthase (riboflavin synthase, beta subunit) [Campylobacter ureolyticus RIGS 9880]|jgi:6,7-dimethyl-8-ribityllumazine synthase|uniref:6,7-dimethyl-8-ribityllumazine synthase n=2 Tax=Campylobacter ureolyticus TaxID=827 RepID=A0A2I1NAQ5_9BACT|nr:6,7-dimethyl-8-ribityllumazine synthase [Campylobacter ureolyticus]AKT91183.1 6,7-dimethyl-8-ribityllumazine synthase (riboflavin synthase, beta subunit) [Campylobacter ureolyticus RIGS 9880]MCR8699444.1 6,7-dimethyl-8-ribityllumazine synthase [Campylobacter ureolyticus]MCZ6105153.1 6,7-dimethyl-8-ribityllumazine synthase [Campylobacter ureolyticus]MCZ6110517.1 6,7-dimethyl-8-ribityllumazine synthase [Campylobacter ureolyticus]MCZ6117002.1 6,7-dimethyl-8-ribityllumazine synthase [Campylobac
MKIIEGKLSIDGSKKVAIISSRFNHIITDRLVEGAKDAFLRHGGKDENLSLILVPGAFEIPFALQKVLESKKFDAVCCVGAVIRGSTPHFDYVSAETTKGIANVTLKYNMPVTFGVLTTDTIEQAIERAGSKAGNKGFEAMSGLIELLSLYENLGE